MSNTYDKVIKAFTSCYEDEQHIMESETALKYFYNGYMCRIVDEAAQAFNEMHDSEFKELNKQFKNGTTTSS